MREYGFSLTRILPEILFSGKYGSVETRIIAYFMQCYEHLPGLDRDGTEIKSSLNFGIFQVELDIGNLSNLFLKVSKSCMNEI